VLPPDTRCWNLDVNLLGPDGQDAGSWEYLASSLGDAPAGVADVQLCGVSSPARFTLTAKLEVTGADS
jgi:hypothetical protein